MPEPLPDAVYAKTPQGSDEVATRRHGLAMRVRQLLILVDGRRSVADLAKLVPEKDLVAHLAVLEDQGFVVLADAPPAGRVAAARAPAAAAGGAAHVAPPSPGLAADATLGLVAGARLEPAPDPGPATLARLGPATRTGGPATRPGDTSTLVSEPLTVPAGPATRPGGPGGPMRAAAATAAARPQRRDLETLRRTVVRHLVDAIGPHADDMAVRVERCRSVDELRQILPSVAGLVEAIRGRAAMAEFMQRVGGL